MALPSSPPLPPLTEYPSSPILPASDGADLLPVRPSIAPIVGGSRKRQFSDYGSLSSDPWFSEATSDAEEEASVAEQPRRKRLVRGPWWKMSSLRRGMAKRERLRNADSGVWLGSDTSDESVDGTGSSRRRLARLDVSDSPARSTTSPPPAPSPAEALASRTIHQCVDGGREMVDLSDLGLTHLSTTTLQPLHQLIRQAHTDLTRPPSEDGFGPLTPSIQLFLSGNKLSSLPTELFTLTNITVLSLRNNELAGLSPAIGRLTKLKEVNVAQNRIRWLPWEMFDLFDCRGSHRQITTRPNPLTDPLPHLRGPTPLPRPKYTPSEYNEQLSRWGETDGAFFEKMKQWYSEEGVAWSMRHELELRLKLGRLRRTNYLNEASRAGVEIKLCNEQLIYLASSAVRIFEVDGSPPRNVASSKLPDDDEIYRAVVDPLAHMPTTSAQTTVPSLFELSLRSLQQNFNLQDASDYPDDLPTSVNDALQRAAHGAECGNETCSVCGRAFIIARAEWMEYWFSGYLSQECLTQDTVLPFLRKACSWACARPSEMGAFRV